MWTPDANQFCALKLHEQDKQTNTSSSTNGETSSRRGREKQTDKHTKSANRNAHRPRKTSWTNASAFVLLQNIYQPFTTKSRIWSQHSLPYIVDQWTQTDPALPVERSHAVVYCRRCTRKRTRRPAAEIERTPSPSSCTTTTRPSAGFHGNTQLRS